MRVKNLFLACMAVAGSIAGLTSAYFAYDQYRALSAARETQQLIQAAHHFSSFVERLAVERGAVNQLLVSEIDPTGKLPTLATELKGKTDETIVRMQESLNQTSLGQNPAIGSAVSAYLQKLQQLRSDAIEEGKRPLAQRTAQVAPTFIRAVLDISTTHSAILYRIGAEIGRLDRDARQMMNLVELSTGMREVAGARSIWFSRYAANQQKFSADLAAEIDRMTGRIQQLWQMTEQATAQVRVSPVLKQALDLAKRDFVDDGGRIYDEAYHAARNGVPMRFTLSDWREWTTKSLQTIPGVREAAVVQALADVGDKIAASRLNLAISLAALVAIAAALAGLVILFSRRVVAPLHVLTQTVGQMLAGSNDVVAPKRVGIDEIDAIRDALESFQANLVKIRELEAQERESAAIRLRAAQSMASVVSDVGDVVAAAAAGDFSARLQIEQADEQMQKLVAGINEINAVVDLATTEFAAVLQGIADGDLTTRVGTAYQGRFAELKNAINDTVDRLSSTVRTIQVTSADVGLAAREINMGADDLSKRTEEQASSLEETAATTEELAASVKASAQASRQAAAIADEAMQAAESGGVIAGQAVEAMARIESASQKISDIIRVIDDIAFQTNLLALNAAVEAARAGDAGKGFAVVASEVRTLAQRSGEAAKDISGLISSSNTEVGAGVKLVRQAGQQLNQILAASQKVAATIADISAAAGEQAGGIDEMSQAVAHLDEMTQQNAALAEQSAASASSLTGKIGQLNDLVAAFRTGHEAETQPARYQPALIAAPARPQAARPAPAGKPAAVIASASRASTRTAGAGSEPERLRKLAESAFAQTKAAPKPAPRKVANGRANDAGWEEF